MEFDSPEVAKEFPGLYRSDGAKDMMSDPVEYDEDDKKKKKDKKDSKKDKGYAALAGESSPEEEDAAGDPKSPGKKKLKAFKLSGKKKDKDKDKDGKKSEKKTEKSRKFSDFVADRKPADKELVNTASVRMPFSAERHRDYSAHRSSVPSVFMPSMMGIPKSNSEKTKGDGSGESTSEKSAVSALNAFLNAPAPLFLSKKKDKDKDKENGKKEKEPKKDKERKKDKEPKKDKEMKDSKKEKKEKSKDTPSSSVAKVKLKLMRSKNSLEDPHSGGDLHDTVSHQFPDDPESLSKEIKKYEQLLEQTHTQIKSSKKVSKKQEEQLWELQRTLTQLKRKLRSINALSSASMNITLHHQQPPASLASSTAPKSMNMTENVSSNTIPPPPVTKPSLEDKIDSNSSASQSNKSQASRYKNSGDDIQLDFTLKSPEVIQEPPFQFPAELETSVSVDTNSSFDETIVSDSIRTSESVQIGYVIPQDGEILTEEAVVLSREASTDRPIKQPVQRSLDFNDSNDFINDEFENDQSIGPEETKPNSPPQEELLNESIEVYPLKQESPVGLERERMEVKVLVHNESRDDSSFGTASDDEDHGEPEAASLCGADENIGNVVDDANAMIGSMHEELEAAAVVFGQRKFSVDGSHEPHISAFPKVGRNIPRQMSTKVSKSEPTFGDQDQNDSSDTELIRDDEGFEEFSEDLIPELMALPIFETDEYIVYENQQLQVFNEQLRNEIMKEELEVKELSEEAERLKENRPKTLPELQNLDMEQLIKVWQVTKAENEALHDNVNKLKELVVISRLEEFKLETRVRYLEDQVVPISPITTTTPLQPET